MNWKLMENAISFKDKLNLAKFILTSNSFTNGTKVKQLENEWNSWLGSEYSLFVSSGSTANFLLISAIKELYGLKSGDKVLVPSCTWMTNVAPVIQLGLKPIFCDIQLQDFSFDESQLVKISKKHKDIKLIFVTHLLGFTSLSRDSGLLQKLFPKAYIIDDVCESHGCKSHDGTKIGSNSLGATFSTYFGHHLTSIEGGFVSTNNVDLYDLMKMKRSHGMARESLHFKKYAEKYSDIDSAFLFITDGYNFRNTEISAVLGSSQLKKLDTSIEIRNDNFQFFCEILNNYSDKICPISYTNCASNFCLPLICKSKNIKESLEYKLIENHIEYRPIVSGNILKHPFLQNYKIEPKETPYFVDMIHECGIYIGNNQFIGERNLNLLNTILESL